MNLPISALILTKNNASSLKRAILSLRDFDEVFVIDSNSTDDTKRIATEHKAKLISYAWNGQYPKKKQWALNNVPAKHDWVFFLDADEEATPEVIKEFQNLDFNHHAGFFVKGQYTLRGKPLEHGMQNNKIALIHRKRMVFPVIDDLDIPEMGEIEGHYQPDRCSDLYKIGQTKAPIIHNTMEDLSAHSKRHQEYALWEAHMTRKKAWPKDPILWREGFKRMLRQSFLKPFFIFLYSYILKRGFMDGTPGYKFALNRAKYAALVIKETSRAIKNAAAKTNKPT